jgi:hypothetical protein
MEAADLSDEDLLAELRTAQNGVVGARQIGDRRAAWQRVMDAIQELEHRYPIAGEPDPT